MLAASCVSISVTQSYWPHHLSSALPISYLDKLIKQLLGNCFGTALAAAPETTPSWGRLSWKVTEVQTFNGSLGIAKAEEHSSGVEYVAAGCTHR